MEDLAEYGAFEVSFSYDGDQVEADIMVEPEWIEDYFLICDKLDERLVEESYAEVVGEGGTIDVGNMRVDADYYYGLCRALDRKLPFVFRRMYEGGWRRRIYGPRNE